MMKKARDFSIPKGEWVSIGGKRFYTRSRLEKRYAQTLELKKRGGLVKDWQYEPQVFWFEGIRTGCTCYKPDFFYEMMDGTKVYVECKGYCDARSFTKLKRFAKYFPQERLMVWDGVRMKEVKEYLQGIENRAKK